MSHKKGIFTGIWKYGKGMAVAFVVMVVGTLLDAYPLNKSVDIWHIMTQCIIFFMLVGLVEEVLLRGCVFNALLKRFGNNKRGVLIAIAGSSILFSLMHLVGAPSDLCLLVQKLVWTFCGGVAFATMYYLSKNILCEIIMHGILDITALPAFISSKNVEEIGSTGTLIGSIIMLIFAVCYLEKSFRNHLLF